MGDIGVGWVGLGCLRPPPPPRFGFPCSMLKSGALSFLSRDWYELKIGVSIANKRINRNQEEEGDVTWHWFHHHYYFGFGRE